MWHRTKKVRKDFSSTLALCRNPHPMQNKRWSNFFLEYFHQQSTHNSRSQVVPLLNGSESGNSFLDQIWTFHFEAFTHWFLLKGITMFQSELKLVWSLMKEWDALSGECQLHPLLATLSGETKPWNWTFLPLLWSEFFSPTFSRIQRSLISNSSNALLIYPPACGFFCRGVATSSFDYFMFCFAVIIASSPLPFPSGLKSFQIPFHIQNKLLILGLDHLPHPFSFYFLQ